MADLIRDERTFPLGSTVRGEVGLDVSSGELRVRGGAREFCEAVFEYSHPELKPEVSFEQEGDEAELEIRQPEVDIPGRTESRWDIALNSDVVLELGVDSASGGVDLDLRGMRVSNVEVDSASGKVDVRLDGEYPELDELIIESASGSVDVDLAGIFPVLDRLEVESVSGRTRIGVRGACPGLGRIEVDSKSGIVEVDMSGGQFERDDLGVQVESISGSVSVTIPAGVGASLQASVVSGRIQAEGFNRREGGRLVNDAFGSSAATLWLNLSAISGSIRVLTG